MGIGERIRAVFRARRGAKGLDNLQGDLDATYRRQLAQLQQVRRGVADVTTSRKRVEVRLRQMESQSEALDAQAGEAVSRGDDAAARGALGRKVTLEAGISDLRERHAALAQEETALSDAAMGLEDRIEDFRMRKDTLSARHSAATARSEVNSAGGGITSSLSEVNQQMAEAERHTRELEAKADAVDELVAEGVIARPGEKLEDVERRRFDAALGPADGLDAGDAITTGEDGHDGQDQISQ
ncbi:PspA/IM30 family protein [Aeromicrobium sp. CTD01-1L150]|uniref:PspA/IM30 family protein n=1 Tax=Aeromicrobium sp. CTD01-1L150 TaxID=3341830 RepID=UPI0035C0506F